MQRGALDSKIEVEDSEMPDLSEHARLIENPPERFDMVIPRIMMSRKLADGNLELTEGTLFVGDNGSVGRKARLVPLPIEYIAAAATDDGEPKGPMIGLAGNRNIRASIGGAALLAAACGSIQDNSHPANDPGLEKAIAKHTGALTAAAAASFAHPQETSWTEAGDWAINLSRYDGRYVMTFSRVSDIAMDGSDGTWAVDCERLEACMNGAPQEIQGLPVGFGSIQSSAIYTTPEGENRIIFKLAGEQLLSMGIEQNAEGNFVASGDPTPFDPQLSTTVGFSFVEKDNSPHIITNTGDAARRRNLNDLNDTEIIEISPEDISRCGGPHFDGQEGSVWMGSKFDPNEQECELITAATLQELANNIVRLNGIARELDATDIMSPRVAENFLIFVGRTPQGTKIYHALVQPHCGDGEQAPWETPEDCPEDSVLPPDAAADAAQLPPDAAPPDAAAPDAAVDAAAPDQGPPVPDQGPPPVDQGPPPADTLPGDAALPTDGVPPADATPPVDTLPPADTLPPVDDTSQPPDAASDAAPNPACETLRSPRGTEEYSDVHLGTDFIVQTNDCRLQICDIKVGNVDGHRITGEGEEFCSGKIRIEGQDGEIDFSFTHTTNGTVKIDCKLLPGQAVNCQRMPKVRAAIEETLLHLNMNGLIGEQGVNTGSGGSEWDEMLVPEDPEIDGDFNTLFVTSFQRPGEDPIVVFRPSGSPLIIIPSTSGNYGRTWPLRFDEDGNYIEEEPFPQFPDTGTPKPEDASVTEPPKTDAEVQPPATDDPKKAPGCKCDFGLGQTPIGGAALLAFMGLLARIFKRRKQHRTNLGH